MVTNPVIVWDEKAFTLSDSKSRYVEFKIVLLPSGPLKQF